MSYGIYQKDWMIGKPFADKNEARIMVRDKYKYLFSGLVVKNIEQIRVAENNDGRNPIRQFS